MHKLKPGGLIGVISPAWIPIAERLTRGKSYLEKLGYRVRFSANINSTFGYFSGTDDQRLADLHAMFADPEIDAVFCARGGWGGLRLVDRIDYDLISRNAKPFVGYSDVTTLQLAIWKQLELPTISGPMVAVEMGKGIHPFTEEHFWSQLNNETDRYVFDFSDTQTEILSGGKATGLLLGGCLAMVSTLLGTPFSPDYNGAVLFIEDIGEKPYKIDRYLAHLKQAGVFDHLKGLILGEFIDCTPDPGENSFLIPQIFNQYFSDLTYPVISNFPYGHGDIKFTMPIGCQVHLDTDKKKITLANIFKPATSI